MHCLVTGASGYLGRALIPALARRQHRLLAQCYRRSEAEVRALLPQDTQASTENASLRVIRCELGASAALPLCEIDVVFHLAGIAHQRAEPDIYAQVNVDATLALAQAAVHAGVKRFVFISSVKAAAARCDAVGKPEPMAAAEDPYAQSKRLAEAGLHDICRNSPMELVIVRPALVYGDDAGGQLGLLRRWCALRLPRPPAGGQRSMVARDDVCRLLVLLAEPDVTPPTQLTVTDGEAYTARRLHGALCRAIDRRPLLPSPPNLIWRVMCWSYDRLRAEPPGSSWRRLTGTECYPSQGFEALGFSPALNFERSLGLAA